ncbi:hypothetical protein SK128_026712 [Halocaridina rubra]|uniref:Uncharacterized protein n=1 Tax=Halocaridina rubra TaxID=373956 RepID=A0AAN8ZXS3_HALRR
MKTLYFFIVVSLWVCLSHGKDIENSETQTQYRLPVSLAKRDTRLYEDVVIDGLDTTIGLATAYYFRSVIPSFNDIMMKILGILIPKPEEDIDYFEIIKGNVQKVVGDYIDEHNMNQLEIYKTDLGNLMQRYFEAPITSETYPDKNTVANSLSISIISNRFLVEAGERPQSMIIHFADIASMHILVLQDVAETYTSVNFTSRWWVDLNNELDHYIDHGKRLQDDVVDWRNDMMTCSFDEGGKYDSWIVDDQVTGVYDECLVLHGNHECDDHCQAYQLQMNREVTLFIWEYMGKALMEWETLKVKAEEMASRVTGDRYV